MLFSTYQCKECGQTWLILPLIHSKEECDEYKAGVRYIKGIKTNIHDIS